jgi:hypothetical protein
MLLHDGYKRASTSAREEMRESIAGIGTGIGRDLAAGLRWSSVDEFVVDDRGGERWILLSLRSFFESHYASLADYVTVLLS